MSVGSLLPCRQPCPASTSARSDCRGLVPAHRHGPTAACHSAVRSLQDGIRPSAGCSAAQAATAGSLRHDSLRITSISSSRNRSRQPLACTRHPCTSALRLTATSSASPSMCRPQQHCSSQQSLRASTTEASTSPSVSDALRLMPPQQQRRQPGGPSGSEIEATALRLAVDWTQQHPRGLQVPVQWPAGAMEEAYQRCGIITQDYAKTFYLGTKLMTPAKAKAIWGIYVWCRRTDELVDGPNASRMTPAALDHWEERLEAAFEGRPYDILDAALTATVAEFPVSIQPFRDMIDGMRMDLVKSRYNTFDELYEYCYKVAGTVGLMTAPVMGTDPSYKGPLDQVYKAALSLGVANQLTNILRDVGEDSLERDRLYLPLDELAEYGMSEEEVLKGMFCRHTGAIDDRWVRFMKFQIARAKGYFADAQAGVNLLDENARWPVWSALILYRKILDSITRNKYDNFTTRAYVSKFNKYRSLAPALLKAKGLI